jgi:hypothetical protein
MGKAGVEAGFSFLCVEIVEKTAPAALQDL